MAVTYDQLKVLTEAVNSLNVKLDERVSVIEEWQKAQNKTALPVSQGGTPPAEGQPQLDTINAEVSAKIAEYKELIAEQKEMRLASQRPSIYSGGYESETHQQKSDVTKAFVRLCKCKGDITRISLEDRKLIDPGMMDRANLPEELKVMVSAVADLGGFFAGTDFSAKFIQKLFLISPWRSLCDVQTIGGEKLVIPTEGGTDTNVTWSDEQTGIVASTDPTVGLLEIYARELNGLLKIANQNLEDSTWDIQEFLMKRLTRQFAQKEGTAITKGDGVARPEGIINNASINSFTGTTASKILPDDVIQMMHTGKSGYRKTATWAMSNNTIGVLRLFKDSQNRPIWQMFGQEFIETLYGRPIVEIPDMVNPASGNITYTTGDIPILFGDFNQGYQIVDRIGLSFSVLRELYAVQNQVAFIARMRVGGKVVLPEAITKLVIA